LVSDVIEEITMNTILYRNRSLAIMRYLSMSVTPKDHCIEDHAVQLMVLPRGLETLEKIRVNIITNWNPKKIYV
jgi:hypothetical protein